MITYCGYCPTTRKYNKENKIDDFQSHFSPPKSMPNLTNFISKCGKFIPLYIYYSKHALSNKLSFPRCRGFPAAHTFKKNLYQTHVRKCKITLLKSGRNLSSLLSIVGYIFFNLFLVVHLRKRSNIPPKIACF